MCVAKRIHATGASLFAMGLNSRALLLCVFLLGVVRFIVLKVSEQEFHREYARQMHVAYNATAETELIDSGCQISRSVLMMLQLLLRTKPVGKTCTLACGGVG